MVCHGFRNEPRRALNATHVVLVIRRRAAVGIHHFDTSRPRCRKLDCSHVDWATTSAANAAMRDMTRWIDMTALPLPQGLTCSTAGPEVFTPPTGGLA